MLNSSGSSSEALRQSLSALMDGRVESPGVEDACTVWRKHSQARECWHTYHLIGDVLRSDELAAAPARDEAFLVALRDQLAKEPVPLAPSRAPGGWRQRLMAPIAVAAGFVAVAGVLVVLRVMAPDDSAGVPLAAAGAPDAVTNGQLIRDARLDRYLAAHRRVSNGAAVQVPGSVVRSVETVVLETK
ncbi:sigma-E factor negative regulatory protein [Aquincola sp. S2]|uniref:Sigma-E factor negative regulatory protein n=1 Tax=Pseudaquabacterium terrae TaxID=2732868 RepID=A0ABX2EE01_9BURK|nr:sigma-E factor negative regulatory protein [Aquabacterium terrae]NRF66840.1 sigma-E factor negative regulatory protein [Aquabacterium terrae]